MCLKHGTKYSSDYVNKLYNGVLRHCTIDFEMVCLTDDPRGLHPNIKVISLPAGLQGWWCKPYMYSKDLPINGVVFIHGLGRSYCSKHRQTVFRINQIIGAPYEILQELCGQSGLSIIVVL